MSPVGCRHFAGHALPPGRHHQRGHGHPPRARHEQLRRRGWRRRAQILAALAQQQGDLLQHGGGEDPAGAGQGGAQAGRQRRGARANERRRGGGKWGAGRAADAAPAVAQPPPARDLESGAQPASQGGDGGHAVRRDPALLRSEFSLKMFSDCSLYSA